MYIFSKELCLYHLSRISIQIKKLIMEYLFQIKHFCPKITYIYVSLQGWQPVMHGIVKVVLLKKILVVNLIIIPF